MRLLRTALFFAFIIYMSIPLPTFAQSSPPPLSPPNDETGMPSYQAFGGAQENISLATGNLNVQIPLLALPGRAGHNVTLALEYDSALYALTSNPQNINSPTTPPYHSWQPDYKFPSVDGAWRLNLPVLRMTIQAEGTTSSGNLSCWTNFVITLADGSRHQFNNLAGCYVYSPRTGTALYPSVDRSPGYSLDTDTMVLDTSGTLETLLHLKDGTIIHFPVGFGSFIGGQQGIALASKIEDPNGNIISISSSNCNIDWCAVSSITDTVGRTVSFSGTGLTYSDSNGNTQTISWKIGSCPLNTDLSVPPNSSGVGSYSTTCLTSVTLPNGTSYQFSYNSTDGELSKIVYPTGGYTRYDYETLEHWWEAPLVSALACPNCTFPGSSIASYREVVAKHACRYSAGNCSPSQEDTTTYTPTIDSTKATNQYMAVVDPLGNLTNYQFSFRVNTDSRVFFPSLLFPRELMRYIYQGQSTLLRAIKTDYSSVDSSGRPVAGALPTRKTTTLVDSNQVTKTEWDYGSTIYGFTILDDVIEQREFNYGTGAPASLLVRTDYTWLTTNPVNSQNYTVPTLNILNRKTSETVYDSTSNTCQGQSRACSQVTYEYDNYSHPNQSMGVSGAADHDATFSTTYTTRGNVTAKTVWRNTDGAQFTTTNQYDDAGNLLSVLDPKSNKTSYSYTDAWANAYCAPSGASAAYVTTITNALGQKTTKTYESCSGLLASVADPNLQPTSFTYDLMGRLLTTSFPDTGQITNSYNDTSLPVSVTTTTKITSITNKIATTVVDGLGRVQQSQLTSDPSGTDYVDTTYDSIGRKSTVSNPYRTVSDSTYGITTYNYDALSRTISVTKPDGSIVHTAYCGSTTLVTDEAGHWRRSTADALGRLIEVDEPNSLTATVNSNGCPGTGEPIWATTYGYDALDDLTSVLQGGSRNRGFTYNSLKELTVSTNPESGSICYGTLSGSTCQQNGYDSDGNLIIKTDARGITTTYAYDALNRATGITYSNGDPSVAYSYDQSTCIGQSPCYNVGRRTTMTDAGGTENLSYDKMGREWGEQRTTNSVTKATAYTYDLAGDLATLTYPSGRTITYSYNSAQQPVSAIDVANSINYATNAVYAPEGGLAEVQNGSNLYVTSIYNDRMQPCWLYATTNSALAINTACNASDPGPGNILDLQYNFNLGSGDNGNVIGIANNRDTTRNQSFSYDQVNRLLSGQTRTTSGGNCWGETYSYDQWANLQGIGIASGYTGCTQEGAWSGTATGSNQLPSTIASYDSSGNVLTDSFNIYTWNAESEMKSGAGVNYTYDGDGNRLEKSSGKMYWYGAGTEILDESDLSGNFTNEYVFFGGSPAAAGKRIAMRNVSTNTIYYYAEDMLGSSRTIVQAGQTSPCYDADFYPFGGERDITTTCSPVYKFEGKERDSESGLDNFGARYNASTMGRFMSPDPLGGRMIDPQTLNKYAYVRNNPTTLIDPTGMYTCADQADCKSKQDIAFEKSRQQDLKSKDSDVVRAAKAYGDPTKDNGVGVKFGDPGKGRDAITTHGIGQDPNSPNGLRAEETVTVRSGLSGSALDAAVGHEGSHVADAQDFVSAITTAGGMDQSKNLSTYATELKAYMVTQSVLSSENEKRGVGDCGVDPCILGAGVMPAQAKDTINRLLANPANQYGAAPNYGVTPANPGPVLYPSLTTPK